MIVKGQNLFMTRGDSETISVACDDLPFVSGDKVEFTMRSEETSPIRVIHKEITSFEDGVAYIVFRPADTSSLNFGEYVYDIQVTKADGTVKTIVRPHSFEIGKEVTY